MIYRKGDDQVPLLQAARDQSSSKSVYREPRTMTVLNRPGSVVKKDEGGSFVEEQTLTGPKQHRNLEVSGTDLALHNKAQKRLQ